MAQGSLAPDPPSEALAEVYERCRRSFQRIFWAVADGGVASQVSLTRISDENGRLGVWGRDSGADRTGRGSLDDRLRNDPTLRGIVFELLADLDTYLIKAMAMLESDPQAADASYECNSPLDEDCGHSSSSSSSGSESFSIKPERPLKNGATIKSLLSVVTSQVQSLYEMSTLLRRPAIPDKYIRSAINHQKTEVSHFAKWDQDHVAAKITQWTLDKDKIFEEPFDPGSFLCSRLAAGNTRRREQLAYWQKHPERPLSKTSPLVSPPKPQQFENRGAQIRQPSVSAPLTDAAPRSTDASKITVQTFSTVAQSILQDNVTSSGRPKTIYAPSGHGGFQLPSRVPDVPKASSESPTFACSYCFTELNVNAMSDRQLWKKHVFRDLRPYMCTFESCQNPEKMYVTRHDWIYHETQMHRRRWICADNCDESAKSKDLMGQHIRQEHPETFAKTKLPVLLDICERAEGPNEPTECPLCPTTLPLSRLQIHLAQHQEELALFVLPVDVDDVEKEDSFDERESHTDGSIKAVYNRTADLDDLSSLSDISAVSLNSVNQPDAGQQTSDIFSQLLKGEGDLTKGHVQDEVESWRQGTEGNSTRMNNLALVLNDHGKYEEAEQTHLEASAVTGKVLREERSDTLTSVPNLASTFLNQDRLKAAEELEVEMMETSKIMPHDIVIAVMGGPGSGKSTFISYFSKETPATGSDLKSCTDQVGIFKCSTDGIGAFYLVDTPAFCHTHKSDTDILIKLTVWLNEAYEAKILLTGIIYLHRISDVRQGRPASQNLRMFKSLCGDEALSNVILATTFWDCVDTPVGINRESQPEMVSWGRMIEKGSTVLRQDNGSTSAKSIIAYLIMNRTAANDRVALNIQKEMIDQGKALDHTRAGQEINAQILAIRDEHEETLVNLRAELGFANAHSDRDRKLRIEAESLQIIVELQNLEQDRLNLQVNNKALKQRLNDQRGSLGRGLDNTDLLRKNPEREPQIMRERNEAGEKQQDLIKEAHHLFELMRDSRLTDLEFLERLWERERERGRERDSRLTDLEFRKRERDRERERLRLRLRERLRERLRKNERKRDSRLTDLEFLERLRERKREREREREREIEGEREGEGEGEGEMREDFLNLHRLSFLHR